MFRSRRLDESRAHHRSESRRGRRRARRLARPNVIGRHPVRFAVLVVLVGLTPVWVSFGFALDNASLGPTVPSRAAEWARDHGGGPAVAWAENLWYEHHAPPVGGSPKRGAIPAPVSSTTTPTSVALPEPTPITPIASPAVPGEGDWHPAGRTVDGVPAVYVTYLRPDSVHTSLVVGVAWMDTRLLSARLYSGTYIPGGGPYKYTAPVSESASLTLDAAFNAGFRLQDSQGGYYTDGKIVAPLRNGAASFVVFDNGVATVADWGRDVRMSSSIESVRQNLDLLVDHGKPVPGLRANDPEKWGFTIDNQLYVWRSGVGVTADGALVYIGGPGLNITSLADLFVRAGAVRAMELDINTDWVNLSTWDPTSTSGLANPSNGVDLLSDMQNTPGRYFYPKWERDFITMSVRPTPLSSTALDTGVAPPGGASVGAASGGAQSST